MEFRFGSWKVMEDQYVFYELKAVSCLLNLGNGIFPKVMEKVMESHGILASQTCTNPGKQTNLR